MTAFRSLGKHDTEQDCVYRLHSGLLTLAGDALSLAGVSPGDLEPLHRHSVHDLYALGQLPVPLTLGAAVVLDAAEHSQDRGPPWAEAVEHARRVAVRFVTLLPDHAVDGALEPTPARTGRSFQVRHRPAAAPNPPIR
ncbi:MAG TPA: hypothetical protein VE441_05020 [Mycobacterium sp.]|nr:hypothetical protein [Mycobacterium sp.]